jgi:hypothetical protein
MIAIDPGYARGGPGCACAAFTDGRLVDVWFARPNREALKRLACLYAHSLVVWEIPQDDARLRGASATTLIRLAAEGATLAGMFAGAACADVRAVTPAAWKGSVPKPVHHGRLWAVLDAGEQAVLGGPRTGAAIEAAKERGALERWKRPGAAYYPASFTAHNLLDAVALGCHTLGRIK